jgi:hypothetical protein
MRIDNLLEGNVLVGDFGAAGGSPLVTAVVFGGGGVRFDIIAAGASTGAGCRGVTAAA